MNTRLMIERTKANKAGDCTVYIEVSSTIKGEKKKIVRIPTNIKVHKDSWSAKSQSIIRNKTKDYSKINKMLLTEKDRVMEIIADLTLKGTFQMEEIKHQYKLRTNPITHSFSDIYEEFLSIKEQSLSRNGVKDFKTLKTHLTNFQKFRQEKIILSEIDNDFFEKFEVYLSNLLIEYKDKDTNKIKTKKFADSTIIKNLHTLRVFLNNQHDKGMPVNLAFKKFKIKSKDSPALITLEEDEYRLLFNKIDNPRLEKVRRLFLLQCSTGLRYSDVVKIRKSHVRNGVIFMNSTKTRQKLQIPLNNISKGILEGCNYDTSDITISNQKYNDYVKELCKSVGINKQIMKISYRGNREVQEAKKKYEIMSSHHGRRFFITQNLVMGIRPEVIMSMTGHVDFRSFKKYIAITDSARVNAMTIWSNTFK